MNRYIWVAIMLAGILSLSLIDDVSAQEPQQPDMNKIAEEEADRLQNLLELEDWQVFYVDSTLKASYAKLQMEYDRLHKAKVSNIVLYQEAHDKCSESIDASYKSIFTEEQWAAYLKSGAAKQQKKRAKRNKK